MAFLYIGPSGKPWRKHSYSAGNTWDQSPKKYYLQKLLGWKEKDTFARFALGKAFEAALQHHHENGGGGVERFQKEWAPYKDVKELVYTKVEKDWQNCLRIGVDWMKLYMVRQPDLPIPMGSRTIFQREYSKEVFPGDPNYGEIEDAGKLDIVAFADPNHPLLPRLNWLPEYGLYRPIIVDIKTAGQDFPEAYGIAAYDTQLRRYSWQSGIRDVALLWFVKKSHTLSKGNSVSLLEDAAPFKAGQEAVIAAIDGDDVILVANDFLVEQMGDAQGRKPDGALQTTKEAKERRNAWLKNFGTIVPADIITKQRLQFNAGFVTIESAQEAGRIAARQIVEIVNAWKAAEAGDKFAYYNSFGVRFPHDDKNDSYFRAFILGDEAFRNITFTKSDEETAEDLFGDRESEGE
jgi:hypothetical protein